MGISETIVAAMIGALATVTTALFQLFSALRSRARVDVRPKKGSATRSVLAVVVLMLASAAGGFLYAEIRRARSSEDLHAMRQELLELKQMTVRMAEARAQPVQAAPAEQAPQTLLQAAAPLTTAALNTAESIALVPACSTVPGPCEEAHAERIALCGSTPMQARVVSVELFAAADSAPSEWAAHRAAFGQDVGGARFVGEVFEQHAGAQTKAVCAHFAHWSVEHAHVARILIRYETGASDSPGPQLAPEEAVVAVELPAAIAAMPAAYTPPP